MQLLKLIVGVVASVVSLSTIPGFQDINETGSQVEFSIPEQDIERVEDTTGLVMYYSKTVDTLVTSQVFIYDNYSLSGNSEFTDYMVQTGETDTLDVIAQFMIASSEGGELVYFQKQSNTPTLKIMDIGLKYTVPQGNDSVSFISYTRCHFQGSRAVMMSLTAQDIYLNPLVEARNHTWNSLVCY